MVEKEALEFETQSVLGTAVVFDWGKMVGILPVYETKEDALADFPDGPVVEIRSMEV